VTRCPTDPYRYRRDALEATERRLRVALARYAPALGEGFEALVTDAAFEAGHIMDATADRLLFGRSSRHGTPARWAEVLALYRDELGPVQWAALVQDAARIGQDVARGSEAGLTRGMSRGERRAAMARARRG
jgi:hypothetical protein